MAERPGFEPGVSCPTLVFETSALNQLGHLSTQLNTIMKIQHENALRGVRSRVGALGGNRTPYALLRTEALYPMSYKGGK